MAHIKENQIFTLRPLGMKGLQNIHHKKCGGTIKYRNNSFLCDKCFKTKFEAGELDIINNDSK